VVNTKVDSESQTVNIRRSAVTEQFRGIVLRNVPRNGSVSFVRFDLNTT